MITSLINTRKTFFKKKIAVVDDEEDIAQLFADALNTSGYSAEKGEHSSPWITFCSHEIGNG